MTKTISFIGAGNMASSLIGGLIADGYSADLIWASNPSAEKTQRLQAAFDINIAENNIEAASVADVIILAVKPQQLEIVCKEISKKIQEKNPLVISIAAGIRTTDISGWLGGNVCIVRAMPNTPAMLGCGAAGLFAVDTVTSDQKSLAESILRAVGSVVWVNDEKEMDLVTAISGSGPAYFFLMMEAMQESAKKLGLSPENAKLLTLETALGAAKMAIESDEDVKELRKQVTSPNGVTEQAILSFEKNKFRDVIHEAITAAVNRSNELAKELTQNRS